MGYHKVGLIVSYGLRNLTVQCLIQSNIHYDEEIVHKREHKLANRFSLSFQKRECY